VFGAVTGAFLRPSKSRSKQHISPETPHAWKDRFRPRNITLLGLFLIIGPAVIILPIAMSKAAIVSEDLLIGILVLPWITGFTLLLLAPVKLVIDRARKKRS
jgi:hypothetical protein